VQERGKLLPPGRSFQLRQRDPPERRPEGSAAGVKFLVIQATETVRLEGGLIRDTVSRAGQSRPQKRGIVLAPIADTALKRPVAVAMQKGIPGVGTWGQILTYDVH
jgi:hypothetical protein